MHDAGAGVHAVARFRGLGFFFLTPGACAPGFMLTAAPQPNQRPRISQPCLLGQMAVSSVPDGERRLIQEVHLDGKSVSGC